MQKDLAANNVKYVYIFSKTINAISNFIRYVIINKKLTNKYVLLEITNSFPIR